MKHEIVAILLAAGQSTRFGGNKLMHPMEDGTPMVLACARTLVHAGVTTIAVVADTGNEVAGLLSKEGVEVFENPLASDGIGTSIACGVAAKADADGWIITLADMPWIPESTIRTVATRLRQEADIVAPVYQGRRGHPVAAVFLYQPGGRVNDPGSSNSCHRSASMPSKTLENLALSAVSSVTFRI